MQKNNHLDIHKSIETGNLETISKKGLFDNIDLLLNLLLFTCLTLALFFMINIELKIQTLPDRIFSSLLIILLIVIVYGAYRKIVENKLSYIKHDLTRTNIKRIIHNLLSDLDKKSIVETDELLIGSKIRSYYQITYTFIITKDKLYFNITNQFPKLNPPVIFGHLFLKLDLKELIEQAELNRNVNP